MENCKQSVEVTSFKKLFKNKYVMNNYSLKKSLL